MTGGRPTPAGVVRRAWVAGATGYVGREVVRRLAARTAPADAPVAHVRPDSPRLGEWRERFTALGATTSDAPWDEDALAAALAAHRPEAVFLLLGTTRARARAEAAHGADASYEAVDYGLSAMLVRAAARAAADTGVAPRLVYLSAAGVGPAARGRYLQVRWQLEQELRAGPLPWTVARPAFVTGPDRDERRPAERVAAVVGDAVLGALARVGGRGLADRWRSLTGAELAAALVRLAGDPGAAGRVVAADGLRALASP